MKTNARNLTADFARMMLKNYTDYPSEVVKGILDVFQDDHFLREMAEVPMRSDDVEEIVSCLESVIGLLEAKGL